MSDAETAQTLASVKDAGSISADRECGCTVYAEGFGAGLQRRHDQAAGTFTRAEFAKLLTTI